MIRGLLACEKSARTRTPLRLSGGRSKLEVALGLLQLMALCASSVCSYINAVRDNSAVFNFLQQSWKVQSVPERDRNAVPNSKLEQVLSEPKQSRPYYKVRK